MGTSWRIERIINFQKDQRMWGDGCAHLGFHDRSGRQFVIDYWNNWVGCLGAGDRLSWSAGSTPIAESDLHILADLRRPVYLTVTPSGQILVSCFENNAILAVDLAHRQVSTFIDAGAAGLKDVGNCEYDLEGNVWVNEVEGGRIWQFSGQGEPLQVLGSGQPGFQPQTVPFEEAQFSWIFDLRRGPDGNLYALDSKNFAVRQLDLRRRTVSTIVGSGQGGYSGDGGDARLATLGHDPDVYFDGPWSLSLDEEGHIYIGDTQNHVVRRVERSTNIISTIAGKLQAVPARHNDPAETDPLNLNFPKICSMDYWNGRLFIPEWDGDLVVLARN